MNKKERAEKALRENLLGADIVKRLNDLAWLNKCEISEEAKTLYRILYSIRDDDGVIKISVRELSISIEKSPVKTKKVIDELVLNNLVHRYKPINSSFCHYKLSQNEWMFS
jgi:hypothetical protein